MPVTASEIKYMKPQTVTDGADNGGRMSRYAAAHGVKNNLFPDVSQAERAAGLTRFRKVFAKIANDDDLGLLGAVAHLATVTPGDDWVTLFAGTQRDTQGDIAGPREYGAAVLAADVAAGATAFDVTLEDAALVVFAAGDSIWLGHVDGSGALVGEYHANITVATAGATVTITLDAGDQVAGDHLVADGSVAASVLALGDVAGSLAAWTETSGAGTYDEATHPPEPDHIGGIEEDWTITFTSATAYELRDSGGTLRGTGGIGADFAPTNADVSKPYFVLRAAGWGGTWASGDSITFTTSPAAAPLWLRQVVPAGAASQSADQVTLYVTGI
jgi:hypothetical protein